MHKFVFIYRSRDCEELRNCDFQKFVIEAESLFKAQVKMNQINIDRYKWELIGVNYKNEGER